ncbi:MAG: hypothetical protein ACM36C_16350 [Acidobacteriota bacterium]
MRVEDVLQRIQGEYLEMPGLRLTTAQAQRLWGLERDICETLLAALVDTKFLCRTRDGAFVRPEGAVPTRFVTRRPLAAQMKVASVA